VEREEAKTETPGEPEEEISGRCSTEASSPRRGTSRAEGLRAGRQGDPEWVFIDLGRKGEGVLAAKELLDEAGSVRVKEGDPLERTSSPRTAARCSSPPASQGGGRVGATRGRLELGDPVDGVVVKEIKGGYEVRLAGGARAFCPHSQMDLPRSGGRRSTQGSTPRSGSRSTGRRGATSSSPAGPCWKRRRSGIPDLMATLTEGMVMTGTVTRSGSSRLSSPSVDRGAAPHFGDRV